MVDGLSRDYAGQYDIKVLNLSRADASMRKLADDLKVEYVPTFVFVNSDGTIRNTVVGGMTGDAIKDEMTQLK